MIRQIFNGISKITTRSSLRPLINSVSIREYPTHPKRFYKRAGILQSDGKFEIFLDQRKLKTPKGNPFLVESEPLALAVAQEWDSQKENVIRPIMHLTAICNTVIDNPNNVQKPDIINYMLNYIQTDTVLYHSAEEPGLLELQKAEWDPTIKMFNDRYETDIQITTDISIPKIGDDTKMKIGKYLNSYNLTALNGFIFAVDTLKSIILTLACVDRIITPDRAVLLSRLEEEYQLGHWGRVEWAHDLSQQELQARLAAAIFFIHCNSSSYFKKEKFSS